MRRIISKIDYDFHNLLIGGAVEIEKIDDLWEKVKGSRFIVSNAIEVEFDKMKKQYSFLAPCICYMILTHKDGVDSELYSSLVNRIILSEDLSKTCPLGNVSYLHLVLADRSLEFSDSNESLMFKHIKNIISSEKGINVTIYPIIEPSALSDAYYSDANFEVRLTEEELKVMTRRICGIESGIFNDFMMLNNFFLHSGCSDEIKSQVARYLSGFYRITSQYIVFLESRIKQGIDIDENQIILNMLLSLDTKYIGQIRQRVIREI